MAYPAPVAGAPYRCLLTGAVIVQTTYLEQRDPSDLVPARAPREPAVVVRVDEPSPEFARFLFTAVGGDWHWTDRLPWTLEQWSAWLDRPGQEMWVSWIGGSPAGYVELDAEARDDGTHVEVTYFGLLPRFVGRGLGGQLLTEAVRHAWTLPDRVPLPPVVRVWLNTCTLDGPHALANYLARGFRVYDTTEGDRDVAETPPGPWPGARPATAPAWRSVRRVVPNIQSARIADSAAFYRLLGFEEVMNLGWIATLASPAVPIAQISVMGADATAPVVADISVEVDDVDAAYAAIGGSGAEIVHPLQDEEWGVRRFFVRDPNGRVVNVLSHRAAG
jgi:uncharacterized glyoxalase superfamily protein PhnB/GNAT superfamily N-acetyltransferase